MVDAQSELVERIPQLDGDKSEFTRPGWFVGKNGDHLFNSKRVLIHQINKISLIGSRSWSRDIQDIIGV